jgi:hypothetical protein
LHGARESGRIEPAVGADNPWERTGDGSAVSGSAGPEFLTEVLVDEAADGENGTQAPGVAVFDAQTSLMIGDRRAVAGAATVYFEDDAFEGAFVRRTGRDGVALHGFLAGRPDLRRPRQLPLRRPLLDPLLTRRGDEARELESADLVASQNGMLLALPADCASTPEPSDGRALSPRGPRLASLQAGGMCMPADVQQEASRAPEGPSAAQSIWWSDRSLPQFSSLAETLTVDTAIVGGGWTGLQLAVRLAEAGQRVAVLERRRLASGTTGGTTAHLTASLDVPWRTVLERFGEDAARLVARSVHRAIDDLEFASRRAGGGDGFERVPGYLAATTDRACEALEQEAEACRRVGLETRRIEPTSGLLRAVGARGALCFERQAEIDPIAHLEGLVQRLVEAGGRVFEHSPVLDTNDDGAECPGGAVHAESVVHATHTPVGISAAVQTRAAPTMSYVPRCRSPILTRPP